MNIDEQTFDSHVQLTPHGELDANSSIHLIESIRRWIAKDHVNFHVDMGQVTYIASAGLGVFVSNLDQLQKKNGKFVLTHLAPNVLEPFVVLGLDKLPNLVLSTDEDGSPDQYFVAV